MNSKRTPPPEESRVRAPVVSVAEIPPPEEETSIAPLTPVMLIDPPALPPRTEIPAGTAS